MNLNITQAMSNTQMITECHRVTTIAPLVILFFAFVFFFLLFGFIYVKKDRMKLVKILIWTVFFTGLIFVMLLLLPNVTQSVIDFFIKLGA